MRNLKRLGSILLAATMMVSLCCTQAFAADGDTNVPMYEIFQIFTGQYADKQEGDNVDFPAETLSNIKWGVSGKGTAGELVDEAVLNALSAVAGDNGVNQPAADDGSNKAKLDVIKNYVNWNSRYSQDGKSEFTLDEVNALTVESGYYLVRQTEGSLGENEAYPTYTVQVLGNKIVLAPKAGKPTIDKKVDTDKSKDAAAIGDAITFTVKGNLPANLHDYKEYFWKITDTMSAGLDWDATRNPEDGKAGVVSATIAGQDVLGKMYVGPKAENGTVIMGFQNVKALGNFVVDSAEVVITYRAVINDKAEISSAGNTNKVNLTYSNDPNNSGDGTTVNDPDNPPVDPTEVSTTVDGEGTKTETWVTGLTVTHMSNQGTPLTGSKFTLTSTDGGINATIEYTVAFNPSADGTYYKLKNGTYTPQAPITEDKDNGDGTTTKANADLYESTTQKYVRTETAKTTNNTPGTVSATIDSYGQLSIAGLGAGTFKLHNDEVPAGYQLADNIEFTLTFEQTSLFSSNNSKVVEGTTPDGQKGDEWFYITLVAGNGTTLPETGGTGTTMFYIGGAVLVLAGAAVLFLKLRKKDSDVAA